MLRYSAVKAARSVEFGPEDSKEVGEEGNMPEANAAAAGVEEGGMRPGLVTDGEELFVGWAGDCVGEPAGDAAEDEAIVGAEAVDYGEEEFGR